MNDIAGLDWKKIGSFIGENIKTVKDRPYTIEEINKLLDAAQDKRLKIAILLETLGKKGDADQVRSQLANLPL